VPLYDYQCKQCQTVTEVRHGFKDVHAEVCLQCGGPLSRVFNPAGIVFKGSGFYITDSRKGRGDGESSAPAATPAAPAAPAASESKKTESRKSDAA
jgi:putative FmdB family regulatory protein